MANTITKQVIENGPRNYVLDVKIVGDGSGEESETNLIDVSGLGSEPRLGVPTAISIEKLVWSLEDFSVVLEWDATANVDAFFCGIGSDGFDFTKAGGPLQNNAGAGKTGDLDFTTTGLGAGSEGFVRIYARKKFN